MSRCPFCKARGVKLADSLGGDYCGRCGRNWPWSLAATVVSDGVPPTDRPLAPRPDDQTRPTGPIADRVRALAARVRVRQEAARGA